MTDVLAMNGFCELNQNEIIDVDGGTCCFGITETVGDYIGRWTGSAPGPTFKKMPIKQYGTSYVEVSNQLQSHTYQPSGGGVR